MSLAEELLETMPSTFATIFNRANALQTIDMLLLLTKMRAVMFVSFCQELIIISLLNLQLSTTMEIVNKV